MVVGMGIEGNVVGMVGSEVAGSGGRVTFGTAGMVGNVGIGKDDGIWVLGKGGNVVGFGKVGAVGNVGKAVLGNGGNVACGMVGIVGNGGNTTLGRAGIVGTVCSSWRAAQVIWVLESANAKIRDRTKQCWKAAIFGDSMANPSPKYWRWMKTLRGAGDRNSGRNESSYQNQIECPSVTPTWDLGIIFPDHKSGKKAMFDGGGEKNGIVGMVVGMVGIEGNVVGNVGSEVAGSGGRVTLGTAGMVGSVGIGKDEGIWVLGKGGNVVGFGKVGAVGSVGKAVVGNGGSVAWGMVGIAGNGGNATVGTVCSRWRAAQVVWTLDSDSVKNRKRAKQR
ncbi:uncharacterized protein LOC130781535 [Actinidia eriantha]|uniref:uncharacterized protein LOC130781535 n=1 Tax=Actinidia eriantha TaxID=165200 RepID=UPI0025882BCC|nr:uncharacterized protein LOC130781535 [Actinidia eriantha]